MKEIALHTISIIADTHLFSCSSKLHHETSKQWQSLATPPHKRLQDFITFNILYIPFTSSSYYYYYNFLNFHFSIEIIYRWQICAGKFVEYNRFLSPFLIKCISNSFVEFANPSGFCWCFWPTNYCK